MAIGGLIRGYRRWNPVHPTYGAFWGFGLGFGCGVGWGPGFGSDAVGFVGAGCGLGLSIGVTFLGVGIGLPASGLACVPCNVITGAGRGVSGITRILVPIVASLATQTWHSMGTHLSLLDEQLRLRNNARTGGRPLNDQTVQLKSSEDLHNLGVDSQVKFSSCNTVITPFQHDGRRSGSTPDT